MPNATENTKLAVATDDNNDDDVPRNNTSFADSTTSSVMKHGSWKGTVRDYSNVYRQFFGTNVLTMGWSMMETGFVVGPLATLFVAILEYRAILSLLRVKNHFVNREKLVAFGQVGEQTLGNAGSWVVDTLVIICQWLGVIGYAAFSGHNFETVSGIDYNYCVLISVSVSLLVSFFQTPFFLAKLSLFTNLTMFSGVIIIFSQLRFGEEAASKGPIRLATDPLKTMIGLTSLATSLGGITVTLDVERTMVHSPGRYHKILLRMIVFAVFMLVGLGLLSYGSFRDDTKSVLSLSLDDGPAKKAAEVVLVIGPAFESVLNSFQMFVIITDRFKRFPNVFDPNGTTLQFVMLRIVCFVSVAGIAIGVPFYGLITAVNGAFGYGALAFLVPPLMELKIIYDIENGRDSQGGAVAEEEEEEVTNNNNNNIASHQIDSDTDRLTANNVRSHDRDGARNSDTSLMAIQGSSDRNNNNNISSNQGYNTSGGNNHHEAGHIVTEGDKIHAPVDEEENISIDAESIALAHDDAVSPHRKYELFAILLLGGAIIGCGGFAAIRKIVENEGG